ncbi:MAG TPA: hypothetical protein VM243_20475, partial [Phycisphaerae bacterium]|nr:hypothetical protein [Phycisphaerae bacterium]
MYDSCKVAVVLGVVLLAVPTPGALGQAPTICDIQYTTNADGSSVYDGQVIDCAGGIVVGKYLGNRPRIFLQDPDCPVVLADPDCPDGWGGIQVKDWTWPYQLYNAVQIGDWVELTNVRVEEYVGVTFLQWQPENSPGFTRFPGYLLPPVIPVALDDIPAPIGYPEDRWCVENHDAECYESMRLVVRDVTVAEMDLGKARDNYVLADSGTHGVWAADYMNGDKVLWEDYHPYVETGRHFCAVAGLFEQYTSGRYDYYQLVTLHSDDLAVCGDGDSDGDV